MTALPYAPSIIDLSRVPSPDAIEPLNYQSLRTAFNQRFLQAWAEERQDDPTLPQYDVSMLETDPVMIAARSWTWLRLIDRARVNAAVRAVLAPLAEKADLDNIAASVNVARLVIVPADPSSNTPALMESDAALLRRYLLAFDRPAAGSAGRYLFEAWTAWPQMGDAAVVGRSIHGRRGDVDIVVTGPGGRDPTSEELALVRAAVLSPNVRPEAVSITVLAAARRLYSVDMVAEVPPGPDPDIVTGEAEKRVRVATGERTLIGGELPVGLIDGAAYGPSILQVRDLTIRDGQGRIIFSIEPDAYSVPVCASIAITSTVRT